MKDHLNLPAYKAWVLAARPKTLPAAVAPVILGTAMALADHQFIPLRALAALLGAMLLQIGVNLANDYFDWIKGIDNPNRIGPLRVTQAGLIPPKNMIRGICISLGLASGIGVYLVIVGGIPIFAIGVASVISALLYSGGPYPIASHGLGDIFVFLFFGLAAVCGTYYVQVLNLTLPVIIMAASMGSLITAILVVNNLRDIRTDHQAGKRTLAVILGIRWTRIEYICLITAAYLLPVLLLLLDMISDWVLLSLISFPMALVMIRKIWRKTGQSLNTALTGTAQLTLVYSLLASIGVIL